MNNTVYFLVLTPERDAVRLMYYSTFAWPVKNNIEIKYEEDSINIISRVVCSKKDPQF